MNDLDTLLVDALRADADRAPTMPNAWDLAAGPFASPKNGRRWELIAGVAAAMVLVVAGGVWLARGYGDDGAAGPATTWRPPGTEFPLTDLGPANESEWGPVPVDLTHRIGLPGWPVLVSYPTLWYLAGDSPEEGRCLGPTTFGVGCRDGGTRWSVSSWSPNGNSTLPGDMIAVDGLPSDVAFVGFDDGVTQRWQRPVAGVAAFPHGEGPIEADVITGYDGVGRSLGRFDVATLTATATQTASVGRRYDDPPDAGLVALTRDELAACLTERGGVVGATNIATFPAGVDQQQVWDECVASTKAAVAARIAELTPRS